MAAKSSYNKDIHPEWAWALAASGLTNQQIAKKLGIATSTFNKWRDENPEFAEAVLLGKEVTDSKVERSLFQRAIGYEYEEKKVVTTIDPKTGETLPVRIEKTTKVVPPDTTAQIFWLKNRKPNEWRDRRDVAVSDEGDIIFNIVKASEREKKEEE